ncbi:unnamed protein product [Rotaria sordida]|uniref:Uncharacterized protein n=1 Tax=Rotaria sordida TaxID=392033 RepID=A0A814UCW6_9BILA|nr:unnamed protein product [Rotaria sordida]
MLFLPDFDPIRGTAIFRTLHCWPNRIIPYDISAITDANDRITITKAMNQLIFDVGTPIEDDGFEDDMLFLPDFDPICGTAIFRTLRRWPNRIIPYDISAITDANDRITITKAMNQLIFDVGTPIEDQTA